MRHPLFARAYDRFIAPAMERELSPLRRELLAGLHGRVLEVGAGNGLSFAHYPPSVSQVVALEPEPYLRAQAQLAADVAPVAITVCEGLAETLPFEAAGFRIDASRRVALGPTWLHTNPWMLGTARA